MKKILALVLTAATAVSVASIGAQAAAPAGIKIDNKLVGIKLANVGAPTLLGTDILTDAPTIAALTVVAGTSDYNLVADATAVVTFNASGFLEMVTIGTVTPGTAIVGDLTDLNGDVAATGSEIIGIKVVTTLDLIMDDTIKPVDTTIIVTTSTTFGLITDGLAFFAYDATNSKLVEVAIVAGELDVKVGGIEIEVAVPVAPVVEVLTAADATVGGPTTVPKEITGPTNGFYFYGTIKTIYMSVADAEAFEAANTVPGFVASDLPAFYDVVTGGIAFEIGKTVVGPGGTITGKPAVTDGDKDNLYDTTVHLNKGKTYNHAVQLLGDIAIDGHTLTGAKFGGPNNGETNGINIEYRQGNGAHEGSPKGVNGEELMRTRVSFNRTNRSYNTSLTFVKNPTVEIFEDVEVSIKINTTVKTVATVDDMKYEVVQKQQNKVIVAEAPLFGGAFTLMNARYTREDVTTDAGGARRINAASEYPVVDDSAFDAAWGKKLIVSYPNYNVIFPNVKNQNISLNLEAKVEKVGTVGLDAKTPIVKVTFHDIYVKDAAQIEFKIGADAQNFKGQSLHVYELNAKGEVIKGGKELKGTVNDAGNIVFDVAAGSRLSSTTNARTATYGVFNEPQTATGEGDTGGGKNPGTGASDVVTAATAFAAISVAAAGFVALKKSNR